MLERIPIFVSSAHYGLEDLRGELASYLEELGASPLISSESGFPDQPGLPPYAQCLLALEQALVVVGVIDRRYGATFENWGRYPEYAGLSPTHAELRHALRIGKRLIVYIRSDLHAFYEVYRKDPLKFGGASDPTGLDVRVLEMFQELKLANPAPWIEPFRDVRDIKESLRTRLLRDLHEALRQRERAVSAGVNEIFERILNLDPSLRARLVKHLEQMPIEEREKMEGFLVQLEHQVAKATGAGREEISEARNKLLPLFAAVGDALLPGAGAVATALAASWIRRWAELRSPHAEIAIHGIRCSAWLANEAGDRIHQVFSDPGRSYVVVRISNMTHRSYVLRKVTLESAAPRLLEFRDGEEVRSSSWSTELRTVLPPGSPKPPMPLGSAQADGVEVSVSIVRLAQDQGEISVRVAVDLETAGRERHKLELNLLVRLFDQLDPAPRNPQ